MNCEAAKKLIPAFVDGELRAEKAEALREHLDSCHLCRQEMVSLGRTMEAVGAYGDIQPSFTLGDIRERAVRRGSVIRVPAWQFQTPRLVTAAMVLAALALGSVSGIYYGSLTSDEDQAPAVVTAQRASDSFGLDAFDEGLAGAMYVADAGTISDGEVTR